MKDANFFAGAPDPAKDFNQQAGELRPPIDAANWPTRDELDHLDLASRAYTPGGSLEYQVHQSVRYERTTHTREMTASPSPAEEKPLDFNASSGAAARTSRPSPAELRAHIERRLKELGPEFGRTSMPDRGGPDR